MLRVKSDRLSNHHKTLGNGFMREKEHFRALCEYNKVKFVNENFLNWISLISLLKALMFAESKESLALAYANRSFCFLDLKKYDEALLNIQWAKENNYPAENMHKLIEREEKCKQLKAEQTFDPIDELHEFFKLSYPPNPNVPFVADCLYLGPTKKHGRRGIFTSRDLKPGDIVSNEKSAFSHVGRNYTHLRCCQCLKGKMLNLIPCTKSAILMFCSEACRDDVYAKVENLDSMFPGKYDDSKPDVRKFPPEKVFRETEEAFGGRQNLIKFVKENGLDEPLNNLDCTVFDFDFSNPDDPEYKANLIKCLLAFGIQVSPILAMNIRKGYMPLVEAAIGDDKILKEVFIKLATICETRTVSTQFELPEGKGDAEKDGQVNSSSAFLLHMNNRCVGNTFGLPTEDGCAIVIIKPIKAGEQLYQNYQ